MLTVYTMEQSEKWDAIVRSFPDYDVFYLSGYSKAFMNESSKNGEPFLLLYEDGSDRAINVVFKRDVAMDAHLSGKIEGGLYYDLSTPYGYGGFFGNVSDWDKLNQDYAQYCMESRYICEFVRFGLFADYHRHYGGKVESRTHNVVRSLELTHDEMWMDFKQKVRKNVKKARSHGLNCIGENTDDHVNDFLRIYYGTMERTQAEEEYFFSKQFFEELNEMKDNVMYFHALYEGKIVSTELVIYGAENAYSYLGGTDPEYFDMRPNDYLKYEIIKWAKEKGLKNFVLGGGYGSDDGIFQYKLCLAPHGEREFYIGRNVCDEKVYQKLLDIRSNGNMDRKQELEDTGFFPAYRAGGGSVYLINCIGVASQMEVAA